MRPIYDRLLLVVDTTSTTGLSLRTLILVALSAALTKLLGSCSAEIHSTHATTNNDVFILVHASSSGLQLHFTFSTFSSCRRR